MDINADVNAVPKQSYADCETTVEKIKYLSIHCNTYNWDSYGGLPVSIPSRNAAIEFMDLEAEPTPDGHIMIVSHAGQGNEIYFSIEFNIDGEVCQVYMETEEDVICEWRKKGMVRYDDSPLYSRMF